MRGKVALLLTAVFQVVVNACDDDQSYQPYCSRWRSQGYCMRSSTFYVFVSKHCKKTCGFCSTPITAKPAQGGVCEDVAERARYCQTWKGEGYCSQASQYYSFMRTNCKMTCGFCSVATTPPPTPAPTTKEAVVSACRNTPKYDKFCPSWKQNNYCDAGSQWNKFMKDHCQATCGFCKEVEQDCGLVGGRLGRIIGGKDAMANYWKWQVALYDSGTFFCGGSLIAPQWILTAAHCTYYKTDFIESLEVTLGEHDRSIKEGKEVNIGVEKIINHAAYDRATLKNDIALVKLRQPAPLNDYIGLVCLPPRKAQVQVGKKCYVSGWGKIKHPGTSVNVLQQATLPIVANDVCRQQNSRPGPDITKDMVCAGYGPSSTISGCHGDSGGPLVCENDKYRYVLEGAVSWGSTKCDTKDKYTVFTRVSEYIDWINANMK